MTDLMGLDRQRWCHRIAIARAAFGATWFPWIVARAITLLALLFARTEVTTLRKGNAKAIGAARDGLLGSDGGWYRSIAAQGYSFSHQSVRFFPFLPVLTRGLHDITRIPIGGSLLLISNASAFVGAALVYVLANRELHDARTARIAVWIICIAPPAFVLVMGYSESLLMLLAAATFLCIRSQRWVWACLWGFLAGTTRPIGVLLVLPMMIEGIRTWRAAGWRLRLAEIVATSAPVVGLLAYLSWVSTTFGGFLAPIRLQRYGMSKSISGDPVINFYRDAQNALKGSHIGIALHLPWIVIVILLCVTALRRLPSSYGIFSLAVVIAGTFGMNFASFERYALSAFPLAIGAASLLYSRRMEVFVLILSGAGLFAYALLAFLGLNIP